MGLPTKDGITLTQSGQPRPYAASVYAGTVKASDEEEAREKLQKMRGTSEPIFDKQDRGEKWSHPYFTELRQIDKGTWKFSITLPSTS